MRLLALAGVVVVLTAACSAADLVPDGSTAALPTATAVPATVWFRTDEPGTSLLTSAQRSLPLDGDPIRHALEELIAGPADSEGLPVLPPDVTIEGVDVRDGTAWVELDGDLNPPPQPPPSGPTAPLLGIAAIANTLTEFPSVSQVRLQVDGDADLGGWGLPEVLVRDESFLAPPAENDPSPPLSVFSAATRTVGEDAGEDSDAHVDGIRVIDRLGYVRVVVELAGPGGGDVAELPPAEAVGEDGAVRLSIAGVPAEGLPVSVDGPASADGSAPVVDHIDVHAEDGVLELLVRVPDRELPLFALLTDVSPSRIILDVKK